MAVHWIPRFPRWPFCIDWDSSLAQGLRVCMPLHLGPMYLTGSTTTGTAERIRFKPNEPALTTPFTLGWVKRAGVWCARMGSTAEPYVDTGLSLTGWTGFSAICRTNWNEITSSNGAMLGQWAPGDRAILVRRSSTALQYFSYTSAQAGGTISAIPAATEFSASELQNYAFTYDGANTYAWVNGRGGLHAAQTGALGEGSAGGFDLGGEAVSASGAGLSGPVAEWLVWDRALSEDEIIRVQMDGTAIYHELGARSVFLPQAGGGGGFQVAWATRSTITLSGGMV